jgi:hypothetical protein
MTEEKKNEMFGIPIMWVRIMVIVLWLFIIGLSIYSVINIEHLVTDPCDVCMNQTGATCMRIFEGLTFGQ